jgi:hypothetical protein
MLSMPQLQEEDRKSSLCANVAGNLLYGLSRIPNAATEEKNSRRVQQKGIVTGQTGQVPAFVAAASHG